MDFLALASLITDYVDIQCGANKGSLEASVRADTVQVRLDIPGRCRISFEGGPFDRAPWDLNQEGSLVYLGNNRFLRGVEPLTLFQLGDVSVSSS